MPRKPLESAVLAAGLSRRAASASAKAPTLKGVVGPGYSIKLAKNGVKVTSLKAGYYRFVIADKSSSTTSRSSGKARQDREAPRHDGLTGTKGSREPQAGQMEVLLLGARSQMFGFFKVTR